MDEQLNYAACGFLTMTKEGIILSGNQTLLELLEYRSNELKGNHINKILPVPAQLFFQLYFVPLIKVEKRIDEMYISLKTRNGKEIPVLLNALQRKGLEGSTINCILIPMRKRREYENELLFAKKEAEEALLAKNQVNTDLEITLKKLETKQAELLELNKQNLKFKTETEQELELARKIQEASLPDPINNEHLQIEAYYKASSELSGDIYGFYQIDQQRYGIILLDVMGHGISSSLITMYLQSLFNRLITKGFTTEVVMQDVDDHLHQLLQNNDETSHYCTAIYLLIDSSKQEIEYINAGHPPALVQHSNGNQHELNSTTLPLGTFEGILFKTKTLKYNTGDRIILYTDGITDPLELNHLSTLLREGQSKPLTTLKETILKSVANEKKVYRKNDDQCLILIDLK